MLEEHLMYEFFSRGSFSWFKPRQLHFQVWLEHHDRCFAKIMCDGPKVFNIVLARDSQRKLKYNFAPIFHFKDKS